MTEDELMQIKQRGVEALNLETKNVLALQN